MPLGLGDWYSNRLVFCGVYAMNHTVTQANRMLRSQIEACQYPIDQFDHRTHLLLAYIYLVECEGGQAYAACDFEDS